MHTTPSAPRGSTVFVVSFLDILAIIVEVLSWVGLGLGIPLFVAALILRIADARWNKVDIELVDGTGEITYARWFAGDEVRERELTHDELDELDDDFDSATGYADATGRLRFERHSAPSRVLWVLSLATLGVGLVALAVTIVLMLAVG